MNQSTPSKMRPGFCIYLNTFCQGPVPVVSHCDGNSDDDGKYVVFETELEAQREIVAYALIRLQQFLDGERDFDDAITVEEYMVPVKVDLNGRITDDTGNQFGPDVN